MRVNAPLVVHEEFEGEIMVVRNDTGTYYSMSGSAAVAWAAIVAGRTVPQAVAAAFGLPVAAVAADIDRFLGRLREERLVVDGVAPSSAPMRVAAVADPYAAPELHAYSDMQDLLLFDPIHEVGAGGWPDVAASPGS